MKQSILSLLPRMSRQLLLNFLVISSPFFISTPLGWAQNNAIKNTNAIRNIPVYENDDELAQYDVMLCAEYLSLQPNKSHRYQAINRLDGSKFVPVDRDQINLLGDKTVLAIQPSPSTQNKTTKTTTNTSSTANGVTTNTETATTRTPNSFSASVASPVQVEINHKTGILTLNGQVPSAFERRQIQEDCRSALRR